MARILVVDDEESIRFTLEIFLTDEGHHVITAKSYMDAVLQLRKEEYDLVFLDMTLGDGSGLDLLKLINKMGLDCSTIVISGFPCPFMVQNATRLGAVEFLPKPITQSKLLLAVRKTCGQNALQA